MCMRVTYDWGIIHSVSREKLFALGIHDSEDPWHLAKQVDLAKCTRLLANMYCKLETRIEDGNC